MTIRYFPEIEQGSEEWLAARCGIVTASVVGRLITPTLKVADNDTSRGLILTLAAERITGRVDPTWVSADMQRGNDEEPYARDAYSQHYAPATEMGFVTENKWGFTIGISPDGLVSEDGGIEVKSRRQSTHVRIVIADTVPGMHMAQIQTALLVTGRKWWDFVDFSNGMHLFVKRVLPDPKWFETIILAATRAEVSIQETVKQYEQAVAGMPATERVPELDPVELKLA